MFCSIIPGTHHHSPFPYHFPPHSLSSQFKTRKRKTVSLPPLPKNWIRESSGHNAHCRFNPLSHSPFSLSVLLIKKKDDNWQCCVNYRILNAITMKDISLMPTIDELLEELGRASCFSKLDLRQGFHQIHMAEDDIPKIAFRTHQDHYKFKVMSFGLCNTPSTF